MYQTNQQAWDEVTRSFNEANRRTEICQELFGQDNLKGLTSDQRDLFWESVQQTSPPHQGYYRANAKALRPISDNITESK